MTRVAIVGAGPAGLFAAHELVRAGLAVTVFDMGKPVAQRDRAAPYDLLHGMGGSGTFSDGKINFHPEVGGNLYEWMGMDEAWELVAHIERILANYDVEVLHTEDDRTRELERRAAKCGVRFLPIRQAHIGSDHLSAFIQRFGDDLTDSGVTFRLGTHVADVACQERRVQGVRLDDGEVVAADAVLLAPGRVGSEWMTRIAQQHDIDISYNPIDVGVRVEVPAIVMEEVIDVCYDPKFYVRAPTYDDRVRTFCVSPRDLWSKRSMPTRVWWASTAMHCETRRRATPTLRCSPASA